MRIVLTHGCWDILTMGHLEHFERAKAWGDYLIVSVSPDSIARRKGPDRPIRPLLDRVRMLRELKAIDQVWVCHTEDAFAAIRHWQPAWFVQGIDYAESGPTLSERAACEEVGARWTCTTHPKDDSTSALLERIRRCAS